jgi:hypothetical protein
MNQQGLWQIAYHFQRITANEYDAAVLRNPARCPYYAMGDLRSGKQVLICLADGNITFLINLVF